MLSVCFIFIGSSTVSQMLPIVRAKLVDLALASGKIYEGKGFKYIKECFDKGTLLHIGLLRDGGVHSQLDQLLVHISYFWFVL